MASAAGGSARAKAQALRDKASKLEAAADRWEQGASGEARTAELLAPLTAWGYVAFHDLGIPGSRANIDHVVIGPTGVSVIDTKTYNGRLRVSGGTLWHGRYPMRRQLDAFAFETAAVRDAIEAVDPSVPVRQIMCIHGADVPSDSEGQLEPLILCSAADLVAAVMSPEDRLLTADEVAALAAQVEQALAPADVVGSSAPNRKPTAARSATPRVRSALPSKAKATPAPSSLLRHPLVNLALRLVVVLVGFVVVLNLISAIASNMSEAVHDLGTTTTVVDPAAIAGEPPP